MYIKYKFDVNKNPISQTIQHTYHTLHSLQKKQTLCVLSTILTKFQVVKCCNNKKYSKILFLNNVSHTRVYHFIEIRQIKQRNSR